MSSDKGLCQNCPQQHNCRDAYAKMGNFTGPSVLPKVVFAFLLPLVIFTVTLVIFEHILAKAVNDNKFKTFISFSAAVMVTMAYTLIIARFHKKIACEEDKKI